MDTKELLDLLLAASTTEKALELINLAQDEAGISWQPLGNKDNNRGIVEVSGDAGRSIVERLTNGIDAILESEHSLHKGLPECRTPREAGASWLGIPEEGLSKLTITQRQTLAKKVSIKILLGEGKDSRIVEVKDTGIGLEPAAMPNTILSLNESNKMQKHYLAGAYGQGGSSTFAASKVSLIVSRKNTGNVGFTVVKYQDLPPDKFKTGRYVYLTFEGKVLEVEAAEHEFANGTLVKHFGFDLSKYDSAFGPTSLYGLLNRILFDPILPIWLDNQEVRSYRRVIKGSRNALNGAVDEGDDKKSTTTVHNLPMFYSKLGENGQIGIEYWVLEAPTKTNKYPSDLFVDHRKPIILTLNGQNQAELPAFIISRKADLPYLAGRLICHIDCNGLSPKALRELFVSNRENARLGKIYDILDDEIVQILKSDDELARLNREARESILRDRNEDEEKQIRNEVAKLLKLQGMDFADGVANKQAKKTDEKDNSEAKPKKKLALPEIQTQDPPTYISILWDDEISFYPGQRRWLRVETDAPNYYHDSKTPLFSRINLYTSRLDGSAASELVVTGSTPLLQGRMRVCFECPDGSAIGTEGTLGIELTRPGLPKLEDVRDFEVVAKPEIQSKEKRTTMPRFRCEPVDGPEHDLWTNLQWPDDIQSVASSARMESGELIIYYSTVFPKFVSQRKKLEQKSTALGEIFKTRYEVWLAVHSLIFNQNAEAIKALPLNDQPVDLNQMDDFSTKAEREERVRMATLACLVATREASNPHELNVDDE